MPGQVEVGKTLMEDCSDSDIEIDCDVNTSCSYLNWSQNREQFPEMFHGLWAQIM